MGAPDLRIGTSGWSYPSGRGTWNGIFYPPSRGPRERLRRAVVLRRALQHGRSELDVLRAAQGRRLPRLGGTDAARLRVLRSSSTRSSRTRRCSRRRSRKGCRPAALTRDALLDALARPNQSDLDDFRAGIDPLASSGKLGALLAQFPPSFKDSPASRDYLVWLLEAFKDHRVAVELRHSSWSDAVGDTLSLLNPFGSAWVQIDEPKFRFSIRQNFLPNVQGLYYMRLHGRNAKQWWKHEKAEDRYNYLYTAAETSEFAETVDAARQLV